MCRNKNARHCRQVRLGRICSHADGQPARSGPITATFGLPLQTCDADTYMQVDGAERPLFPSEWRIVLAILDVRAAVCSSCSIAACYVLAGCLWRKRGASFWHVLHAWIRMAPWSTRNTTTEALLIDLAFRRVSWWFFSVPVRVIIKNGRSAWNGRTDPTFCITVTSFDFFQTILT